MAAFTSNFLVQDILGVILAFGLFPLVIVIPGYVVGWLFNLFEFRARLLPARLGISLLLSIAISPIFYYLIASLLSMNVALLLTLLFAFIFLVLLAYERPSLSPRQPWGLIFSISLAWIILGIFCLIDLPWGDHQLYFSVVSYDHTTRVSIIDAMARTGVPPINPSYYPGHYVQLTFLYFFWYILGGIIDLLGGSLVDARTALFASVLWCGFALMALIAVYLRQRNGNQEGRTWKQALLGMGLLAVTGLDIIPTLTLMRYSDKPIGDLEHWNEQITAWVGSLLWVPHHMASMIACFVGAMLIHSMRTSHEATGKNKYSVIVFAGAAFASAIGLSVWVTLVFVLFWGIWIVFLYIQKKQRVLLLPMLFAGLVALLLAAPFLIGLLSGSGAGSAGGKFPVALDVRSFLFIEPLVLNSSRAWQSILRLLFLPLNYFLELGFFLLVGIIWLKTNKKEIFKNPYYLAEFLLLATSFIIGTFTRSTLIENNDLGWRAWLPGQFVLLIWSVDVLDGFAAPSQSRFVLSQRTKYNLIVLAVLGVSTTILDVSLLRFGYYFAYGEDAGNHIYSVRNAYATINETLPVDAIIQYNPSELANRPSGLYGMHQSAISDRTAYGVPLDEYLAKVAEVSEIFKMKNAQNWGSLDTLCERHFIDVILIVDKDPLWESLQLLEKQRAPLYSDDYTAVFFCGSNAAPLTP